jgi:putative ABC transport system permease protein
MIRGVSWTDWKLGGRMLVKYPGLSVISGITLAGAIAIGAIWFELTQQFVDPRLPLPDGDRIVRIDNWDAAEPGVEPRALYDLGLWRDQVSTMEHLGAYLTSERNLITSDGDARPTTVAEISASAFSLTRVAPLLGRALLDSDAAAGAAEVVVISYDVWQSRFNGARAVIGSAIRIGSTPATIVGVMPEGFRFPVSHDVWLPLRASSDVPRAGPGVSIFGRLRDGATLKSAQTEMTAIGQRTAALNPTTHARLMPRVSPYGAPGLALGPSRALRVSNIVAWLILAAACANVSTLMFARTATREAEILVRNALGASRGRVITQLFIEAFVLCAAAAIVGVLAANFLLEYTIRPLAQQTTQLPFWWQFRLSPMTFVYAGLLAVAGAALVGVMPAIRATGTHLQSALTRMSTGTSLQFGGVWSVMIVLQVAFAALCLPIGLNIASSVLQEDRAQPTYPADQYLSFRLELDRDAAGITAPGAQGYRTHLVSVFEELQRELATEPSVSSVTFAGRLPGMSHPIGSLEARRGSGQPFRVKASLGSDRVWAASVGAGFFEAFRMPVVAGRAFHAGDAAANDVVVINETLARNLGGNALGVRVRYVPDADEDAPWYEVAGVVRDGEVSDYAFFPVTPADVSPLFVAVHVRGDPSAIVSLLRTRSAQIDPGLRLYDVMALDEVHRRRDPIAVPAMTAIAVITLLALVLSAAGLYSLMSVSVMRRTREIGIRISLGASPRTVLTALFARAAVQMGIGIVIGVSLGPAVMTALGNSEPLHEIIPAMLGASAVMVLAGMIAVGVPARRALRIQPTQALRFGG